MSIAADVSQRLDGIRAGDPVNLAGAGVGDEDVGVADGHVGQVDEHVAHAVGHVGSATSVTSPSAVSGDQTQTSSNPPLPRSTDEGRAGQ